MKLFAVIKSAWASLKKFVQSRYESAVQRWGDSSWLPAGVQDAKYDADPATRIELLRRSRYWERNNGIVNRLVDLFEQFTVGIGLQVIPNSEDETWNQTASEWWQGWANYPDLVSQQSFGTLQSLIARNWFVDGEIFIHKTRSPETGRPRIRLIEAHRVYTPQSRKRDEGSTIVDGVELNSFGRPTGYWVVTGDAQQGNPKEDNFKFIPTEEMIHVFEPGRPGQMRGLTFLYPVMNDLHDMDDLQMQEMRKAKAVADVSYWVENASGEADPGTLRRQRFLVNTQNASGDATTKQADQFYDVTSGAKIKYLKTGEKATQFASDNPSAATQWYWDYLTSKVCAGVGISKLLVIPYSMQGTVCRADLDVSTAFFRARSAVIATAIREVYNFVMGWAVKFDRGLDGAPADWNKVTIRPPRAPNVDVGYNSAAVMAGLEAGTETYEGVYAERGLDWRQELRQRAEEAKYIDDLAKEFGVDRAEIAQPVKPQTPAPQKEEPAATALSQQDFWNLFEKFSQLKQTA